MLQIKRLSSTDAAFDAMLNQLLAFENAQDNNIDATVAAILADIKKHGDNALLKYTRRFDAMAITTAAEIELPKSYLQQCLRTLPTMQRDALEQAAHRVRIYHQKQQTQSWQYFEEDGTMLGQKITPLERVGLYVPGGKACYPSSVLMNALPAQVAGVNELIMVVPTPNGNKNDLVMAAAAICSIDRVFTVGGAQAIGALAYGTQTIPRVDKIVGPGNAYVAAAKRLVFGSVGIDMVAGPSEILVI